MSSRFLTGCIARVRSGKPELGPPDCPRSSPNSRGKRLAEGYFGRWGGMAGAVFLTCFCCVGCESLYEAGVPGMEHFVDFESRDREEEQYRKLYQEEREPEALQWLLINRIEAGIALSKVNEVLGNEGVRVLDDMRFKTNGGHYRRDDQIYKWGPTNDGKSLYLGFREGLLVNFDPSEYLGGLP